jgi:hypothetical protein
MYMAMVEFSPERIFALNPKIRWVGLANDNGEVVFSKMRRGVESLSPEHEDRAFMQLGPMLLTGVSERLAPWAGGLQAVILRYAEATMIIRKFGAHHLAVTIDSEDYESVRETIESLKQLSI